MLGVSEMWEMSDNPNLRERLDVYADEHVYERGGCLCGWEYEGAVPTRASFADSSKQVPDWRGVPFRYWKAHQAAASLNKLITQASNDARLDEHKKECVLCQLPHRKHQCDRRKELEGKK